MGDDVTEVDESVRFRNQYNLTMTVAEVRHALEHFPDTATVMVDYGIDRPFTCAVIEVVGHRGDEGTVWLQAD